MDIYTSISGGLTIIPSNQTIALPILAHPQRANGQVAVHGQMLTAGSGSDSLEAQSQSPGSDPSRDFDLSGFPPLQLQLLRTHTPPTAEQE